MENNKMKVLFANAIALRLWRSHLITEEEYRKMVDKIINKIVSTNH